MELSALKGVSETRLKDFKKMGVFSVEDLPGYFPKNYLDLTTRQSLREVYHNDFVLTTGELTAVPKMYRKGKMTIVQASARQGDDFFRIVWFNQPYVVKSLTAGEYLFYGRVQNKFGVPSLINPSFEKVDNNVRLKGIVPVYTVKGSVTQRVMRDSEKTALRYFKKQSVIPSAVAGKYRLKDLTDSYRAIHFPESLKEKDDAVRRVAIEEYFTLISAFRYLKGLKRQERVRRYNYDKEAFRAFLSRFPFEFTDGQKQATADVIRDMTGAHPMNRMLQGDVGSGKTAVALSAVFLALFSGYQAAFLAPTEVLAEQNFHLLEKFFPEYKIAFLSGRMTAKERKIVKEGVKSGEISAVCGTHAVIQKDVEFASLALCVCDEQQRFGVAQRNALVEKGEGVDVLVMSATPIPRTLSLVFYGDLDVSTIKDKPKARLPVKTSIVPAYKYDAMLDFIVKEAGAGNQTYFVCPKIEGEEESTLLSVTELFDELSERLPQLRIALLHGKMKDAEKTQVMEDFKAKKYDALVSTTVVEVGVDVPDATVMVIYNAERFGLSQLHQLRGRVGRLDKQSYCFLLSDATNDKAIERLRILKDNADGFKIAEYDFELRGAGDFMGTRQSGRWMDSVGGLRVPAECVLLAKEIAEEAERSGEETDYLRLCVEKYEKLKDVVMN